MRTSLNFIWSLTNIEPVPATIDNTSTHALYKSPVFSFSEGSYFYVRLAQFTTRYGASIISIFPYLWPFWGKIWLKSAINDFTLKMSCPPPASWRETILQGVAKRRPFHKVIDHYRASLPPPSHQGRPIRGRTPAFHNSWCHTVGKFWICLQLYALGGK
jgi:hypothetical protein